MVTRVCAATSQDPRAKVGAIAAVLRPDCLRWRQGDFLRTCRGSCQVDRWRAQAGSPGEQQSLGTPQLQGQSRFVFPQKVFHYVRPALEEELFGGLIVERNDRGAQPSNSSGGVISRQFDKSPVQGR